MASAVITFSPSADYDEALRRAAAAFGIEHEYWDIFGRKHEATPEVQRAILQSLGVSASSREDLDEALEDEVWRDWASLLPSVSVVSENVSPREIEISIPVSDENATLQAELRWEDGGVQKFDAAISQLRSGDEAELREQHFRRKMLPLPDRLKLGYHDLHLRIAGASGNREGRMRLIVCPDRAYDPPVLQDNGKTAGVFFALYGLRSRRNWGVGDFTDLRQATDWVADEIGGSFIGLNPLHIIANRQPYNTSPYLPTCIYYRNPLYLDIERLEDFQQSGAARRLFASEEIQGKLAALRAAEFVEYEQVWRLKLLFLKLAFRQFWKDYRRNHPRVAEFLLYVQSEGRLLESFATHQALDEAMHAHNPDVWNWPAWPPQYQDCHSPAVREFQQKNQRRILFHSWLQWLVDKQLAEAHEYARRRGLPIGLYHDLALATDRFGADLWAHSSFYVAGCRVGAPPDDFSPNGQDWSFPPPDATRHKVDGFHLFAESIRKNCRQGGALRLDHVMRFFRLYWIPDRMDATQGTYVLDGHEDWLRILALESVRNQVLVVGEDLGTVEPEFREILKRFGIRSYRLFYFERDENRNFRSPEEYPRQALVSATTHDLPPLSGFWTGRDIQARREAGLIDDDSYRRQLEERNLEKQKMLDVLHSLKLLPDWFPRSAADVPDFTGELHYAVTGFLAQTPSELLVFNQEDVIKAADQQNLPGSTAEYPNWRRKMRFTLDELRTDKFARDCTSMVSYWIQKSGRANGR